MSSFSPPPADNEQYDLICQINEEVQGLYFEKVVGSPVVGEPLSNAYQHPIQYRAITNTLGGMDDPYEGIGWTVNEALTNLLHELQNLKPYYD